MPINLPSCFKRKLGVNACVENCPVSNECYGLAPDKELLNCSCGNKATSWFEGQWILCGCNGCGKAAASTSIEAAYSDWNNIIDIVNGDL